MYSKIIKILFILNLFFIILPQKVNAQVLINEFSPKNPEWVEFINKNTYEVNLENFYFDDDPDFSSDSGNSHIIKLQGFFPANTLCYLDLSGFLNDGGDTPTLFSQNGDVADTYTYTSSTSNISYSRVPDGAEWQTNTAFSKSEINCLGLSTPTPTPSPSPTQVPTNPPTQEPAKTSTPAPTQSPTAKPTPTKSPFPKPTVTPTPTDEENSLLSENSGLSFKENSTSESTATPEGKVAGVKTENKSKILAFILIGMGVGFLGYVGYLIYNGKHASS